jgi:phage baseplate assembly protein W
VGGIDARTGKPLTGFDHVIQSVEKIITTALGERVMREWVGSPGNRLLGELMNDVTLMRWWTVTWLSLELHEPRFRARRLAIIEATRLGAISLAIVAEYREGAQENWRPVNLYIAVENGGVSIKTAM